MVGVEDLFRNLIGARVLTLIVFGSAETFPSPKTAGSRFFVLDVDGYFCVGFWYY